MVCDITTKISNQYIPVKGIIMFVKTDYSTLYKSVLKYIQ